MKKKSVKTLKAFCLNSLSIFLTKCIRQTVSRANAAEWYGALHGDLDLKPIDVIENQVNFLKSHVWSHIIWTDYSTVFQIISQSIEKALQLTRKSWKPTTNHTFYLQELEHVMAFVQVTLNDQIRSLDFADIPTSMRCTVIDNIGIFNKLQAMIIRPYSGSNTGQWLFKSVMQDLINGLKSLSTLKLFSLKHESTNEVIEAVCQSNHKTLQVLDIENSKQVNDQCLTFILKCTKMKEMNIFSTGFSHEGIGKMIANLPKLVHLPRGDFLTDALAWIEDDDDIYGICEFFPSQKYYFHEDWQMEMVAECCPFITKMLFIFHENYVKDYLVLMPFQHLSDLELNGGQFYQDKISSLIQVRGMNLVKLTLISVKEIDYKSLALLSIHCKKLKCLTFKNCNFVDSADVVNEEQGLDENYRRRQAHIDMAMEAHDLIEDLTALEELTVMSHISSLYFVFLVRRCPGIKSIIIGPKNSISDDSMVKILLVNPLVNLEDFTVENSLELTIMTINLLMNNCENLRAIGDLQKWTRIAPLDLSRIKEMVREGNFDLDTSSNQHLRKYIALSEFEKKTYINSVAGPAWERLKLAEQRPNPHDIAYDL